MGATLALPRSRSAADPRKASADDGGGLQRRALDRGLVRRALAGDAGAARELYRAYSPAASAFLRKLGTHPDELEEARQEVFLQFFRYLPSFRGDSALKTWLFRLCITEARRARKRRRTQATLAELLRREPANTTVPPATRSDATIRALFERALDQMKPEQRLAFEMFELQGMTGKEVAALRGHSLPSTFRRLYEAQRVLQGVLQISSSDPEQARPG